MKYIFINLKRFEVPREKGGLCPEDDPVRWIQSIIEQSHAQGLCGLEDVIVAYLLPESLVYPAKQLVSEYHTEKTDGIFIGCQGVHWKDIEPGKNFGAFTSSLPAASAVNIGSEWAIIGHSEERRAKLEIIQAYDPKIKSKPSNMTEALRKVNQLIGDEMQCALRSGLKALMCIGETAVERGEGSFEKQKLRIKKVLKNQIVAALEKLNTNKLENNIVIGYEPVWAIGPGKTPPGKEYINFVSSTVKIITKQLIGIELPVVYGGGLKTENAGMLAGISSIDGGLVALTKFTGEIGFDVDGLKEIIDIYIKNLKDC